MPTRYIGPVYEVEVIGEVLSEMLLTSPTWQAGQTVRVHTPDCLFRQTRKGKSAHELLF